MKSNLLAAALVAIAILAGAFVLRPDRRQHHLARAEAQAKPAELAQLRVVRVHAAIDADDDDEDRTWIMIVRNEGALPVSSIHYTFELQDAQGQTQYVESSFDHMVIPPGEELPVMVEYVPEAVIVPGVEPERRELVRCVARITRAVVMRGWDPQTDFSALSAVSEPLPASAAAGGKGEAKKHKRAKAKQRKVAALQAVEILGVEGGPSSEGKDREKWFARWRNTSDAPLKSVELAFVITNAQGQIVHFEEESAYNEIAPPGAERVFACDRHLRNQEDLDAETQAARRGVKAQVYVQDADWHDPKKD